MKISDIVFVIFSTALVMLMTPGLALFYGGLVNKKNVLTTSVYMYIALVLVSLQWIVVGYSLAFSNSSNGIIGGFSFIFLNGVNNLPNVAYAQTIPHELFMLFQLMFAIITPALISGAFAERMSIKVFIIFTLLWTTFVYDPLAHLLWSSTGLLKNLGALDFAGGTVVHISSGVAGLVGSIVLGKRNNKSNPHNIPMTMLGAGLLWFGWFGFNSGSALGLSSDNGSVAINTFLTTNTAAAAAAIGFIVIERLLTKKITVLGVISGIVAGLVAITPAAGFVSPISSIFIGLIGGILSFLGINHLKAYFGYDDALDVFGCHGIAGTWGAIATGIFSSKSINPLGADGLIHGNLNLLFIQIVAVLVTYLFSGIMTFLILKLISIFTPLRHSAKEEEHGLDMSIIGEEAYENL